MYLLTRILTYLTCGYLKNTQRAQTPPRPKSDPRFESEFPD